MTEQGPDTPQEAPAPVRRRRWWPWLVAAPVVAAGAAVGGVWGLLHSDAGTRWLGTRLPFVTAEDTRGALFDDVFEADRVVVRWDSGRQSVTVTGFRGEGLRWSWRPHARAWFGIDATKAVAREVIVDTGPPSGHGAHLPSGIGIPLQIRADRAELETLDVDGFQLHRLRARAWVGEQNLLYRVEDAELDWGKVRLAGHAQLGFDLPFALGGQAEARPIDATTPLDATIRASGTLDRIVLAGTLRGTPQPGKATPSAEVSTTLLPFAPWVLAQLDAKTTALDFGAFVAGAPETRLSGHARLDAPPAGERPMRVDVALDNALPGRWDAGRLPLARIEIDLQGRSAEHRQVDVRRLALQLAADGRPAGRWSATGRWDGHALALDSQLDGVAPQRLDRRAPAMTVSGPLALELGGLPSPDDWAAPPPAWSAALRTRLDGRVDGASQPVRLRLDGRADPGRIELKELDASAGDAVARLALDARRGDAGWQLATRGTLAGFDPVPWWPGEPGSAWRQGPHRVSGRWELELSLPPEPLALPAPALLQRTAGHGTLKIADTVLAGVPVTLDLALEQAGGRGGTSRVRLEAGAAGNRLSASGEGRPAGRGGDDRWTLALDAGSLQTLAPLARLLPGGAAFAPQSGSARGELVATGRWPDLSTQGRLTLARFASHELEVADASADWRLSTGGLAQQPLELQADVAGLRWGRQSARQLRAELRGTWQEHHLLVAGALPLVPPPLLERWFGLRTMSGTRAQLQATGAWTASAGGGGRWAGRIERLGVGTWDGGAIAPPGSDWRSDWIDARDLGAELQFGRGGTLERLQAAPGRIRFARAVDLRWDAVQADWAAGAAPRFALRMDVAPVAVAPLLERVQPTMGWGGDLRAGAHVDIRAGERFDAEVVLERSDGDLTITDENGTQALGLSAARLGLAAHDGQWYFTQALAGGNIGRMAAALGVRTSPASRWPEADAPLDGVLDVEVANLGVWAAWVPPGWRLSGRLHSNATIGGRFGAPEYTGVIEGRDLGVRNLLQGVNVGPGTVAIRLEGTDARIETFRFKGGDGQLELSGGAAFGETPNARLKAVAERFRVLGRIDRQLTGSGSATLTLDAQRLALDGRVQVDEGLFDATRADAPSLDADVTVRRPGDAPAAPEDEALPRTRRDVDITLDVDLGRQLRVRGRGLDTELRGQLRLTTPGGRLAVNGNVATENGTYAAYGQKLDIDRGIVAFAGAPDNPRLDILALRQNTDVQVGVLITGTAQSPRARLYSETEMTDTERLSWLVLGRASDGLGRADAALLQRAAVALMAGEGEAPTDALMRNLGIDELSVHQSETAGSTAGGEVRDTVISLGKQLSRRWYVGYERGVNATTGTWQLVYRIAQRFTLRAQSGADNALDLIWVWRLDDEQLPGTRPLIGAGRRLGQATGLVAPAASAPSSPAASAPR
ncbi:translocation/assembly module TamB domain-containing protein [Rubrivivax sp. JA1026]|uniref:translocation/assembly module TamB domain-containing protein n=1 Tax=Rubrivivax sp. JA1026 TaxID=2710888 RepID=UPI0013E92496|nr:translocation/assembly module TamB domain-containing protein [Rubrivivax sp. JA1026]